MQRFRGRKMSEMFKCIHGKVFLISAGDHRSSKFRFIGSRLWLLPVLLHNMEGEFPQLRSENLWQFDTPLLNERLTQKIIFLSLCQSPRAVCASLAVLINAGSFFCGCRYRKCFALSSLIDIKKCDNFRDFVALSNSAKIFL